MIFTDVVMPDEKTYYFWLDEQAGTDNVLEELLLFLSRRTGLPPGACKAALYRQKKELALYDGSGKQLQGQMTLFEQGIGSGCRLRLAPAST
ncbi:MAG: hypothetical protein J5518_04020 [Lachnospiraceae bacterium]|nr:hypothetical protein [Lachnospiraceae bacterium]